MVLTPRLSLGERAGRLATRGLPPDLLRDASRRLALAGLGFAAGCAGALLILFTFSRLGLWPGVAGEDHYVTWACGVLLGLGVHLASRGLTTAPANIIGLGIGFEILGGLIIQVAEVLRISALHEVPRVGLPPVALWVAVFPLLLPAPVWLSFVSACVTASVTPIALWLVSALGHPIPPGPILPFLLSSSYLAAGLAVFTASVVHQLRRQIVEARAMGSYRLTKRLGSGGMGEVWSATHRLLARPAAVKLIRPEVLTQRSAESGQVLIERFRREAAAAAMLRSAHTIELYDFGETAEGTFYYVMELLEGVDLQAMVERFGTMPPERAIHLLIQACESLGEAHQRSLIHRDIKPSNLYACRLGPAVDWVKVLDFGLVKTSAPATQLTVEGAVIGTPGYMAPEMAAGGEVVDHRADVYALGCVAYWLLTGELVFSAANSMRMIHRHLNDEPQPPSRRAPQVPPELDAVVLACLAKDPAARPGTAAELARRLAACPVAEPWTAARAVAWWDEHVPRPMMPPAAVSS